jgi:hypothetical protein
LVVELWKSGDLKLCLKISFPKHALITTIYLFYILYVCITCLYVMFYQSSTISLLWDEMCNFTICVISVWPSRAHNWNKNYLIYTNMLPTHVNTNNGCHDVFHKQTSKRIMTSWDFRCPLCSYISSSKTIYLFIHVSLPPPPPRNCYAVVWNTDIFPYFLLTL